MGRTMAVVLFTDLVGSTELRGRLGEEATDELRRRHDQLLAQVVEANNGRVVKGLGDGIMATFAGAADAVAAAVAIQQGIDRLNRTGKTPVPISVRVGLSAGDLAFETDDVHGTPAIEASRLCNAAGGDEIVVSEIVRLLAGLAEEDLGDRGRLELKGLSKPVAAWEVHWEPAAVSSIPMPALLTDVGRIFVGRDAELERLGQLWKETAAGERRVALLAGEPGVGKTRLAAELAIRVHEEGGLVLAGRCDEDLGVPYQPFVEALRHFVDHSSFSDDVSGRLGRFGGELARLIPELAALVADLPPPLRSDPETERYRLFDAVAAWLGAVSGEEPVLLVLDDLQWAAKPTLLLLRHIVRSPNASRLLILGTYRDTELGHDHPLVEVLADLRRHGGVERLPLSGLDSVGVATYMEQAAGHALDDDDLGLARAIHHETEGNPFFLREVLRHLAETGAVQRRGGRWATRLPVDEVGIPEGVREVVGRRLSHLTKDANRVLRLAAVVGPEFELAVLQAVEVLDEEDLLAALEEAGAARLVVEVDGPGARYRFAHALVRDSLYGGLSAGRRVTLHRRVAEAIEGLHAARLDDHLPALAHHWARASAPAAETDKAVAYAVRAGDRALAQLAHHEAGTYYLQALELLDAARGPADDLRRLDVLIALGEAQRLAGDPAHRETLLRAAELADGRGDPQRLARAALANCRGWALSAVGVLDADRVKMLEKAVAAGGALDPSTRARLLATLALELTPNHDLDRCLSMSDEALAIARALDDPAVLADVLLMRFLTASDPDRIDERTANAEETVALAQGLGDPATGAQALGQRYAAAMEVGDIDIAERCLDIFGRIADDLGQPTLQYFAEFTRAAKSLGVGPMPECERRTEKVREIGTASGQPDVAIFFGALHFTVRFEQDRLREVEDLTRTVVEHMPRFSLTRARLALLYCELGREDEAKAVLDDPATGSFDGIPRDWIWLAALVRWALVCSHLDDQDRCVALYRLLAPYDERLATSGARVNPAVAHYLGMLAHTLGRFDAAQAHFVAAAAIHGRIGAPVWLARTRLEHARMLLTRRQAGDADRARELLDGALASARELGLANIERRATALLQDCR